MGAGMQLSGRRKDGSHFPAEISLSSINTEDGVLVSAAVRDISDRVRAEAKFRSLLEAAPDAIVGVTADGRINLVNAQTERLFGYSRDELVGEPIEILVPDRVRGVHPGHRTGYFQQPQPRPMGAGLELAARRKDRTEFPCEISLSSIDTEEGVLVSATVRDVTDRQRAAEAQNRLATIVQSSHDAIMGKPSPGRSPAGTRAPNGSTATTKRRSSAATPRCCSPPTGGPTNSPSWPGSPTVNASRSTRPNGSARTAARSWCR
jgi:hypothetical protein